VHPRLSHGGLGWWRPERDRSEHQEAGPKKGAAEEKAPWCGDCSSLDREGGGGDEGSCFHLVCYFLCPVPGT